MFKFDLKHVYYHPTTDFHEKLLEKLDTLLDTFC